MQEERTRRKEEEGRRNSLEEELVIVDGHHRYQHLQYSTQHNFIIIAWSAPSPNPLGIEWSCASFVS
jgi:hypothetical protein